MSRRASLDRGGVAPSIMAQVRPIRLQRPRRRGSALPSGVIYVGRPTIFRNPFDHRGFGHARSVRLFERWIDNRLGDLTLEGLGFCPNEIEALHRLHAQLIARLPGIAGRNLQCWCPHTSRWCHADILIDRANRLIAPEMVPY
jgi:hypothetical protein